MERSRSETIGENVEDDVVAVVLEDLASVALADEDHCRARQLLEAAGEVSTDRRPLR